MFDWESGELIDASVMHSRETESALPEEYEALSHAQIAAAAEAAEKQLSLSGLEWHDNGEETWTNWGACRMIRAELSEGEWLVVYIGQDDGQIHGLNIVRGRQVEKLPEESMPMNG